MPGGMLMIWMSEGQEWAGGLQKSHQQDWKKVGNKEDEKCSEQEQSGGNKKN